jgi:hypothetical protein
MHVTIFLDFMQQLLDRRISLQILDVYASATRNNI